MKIRAFSIKPEAFKVQAPAGSGKGVNVLRELQKQYAIDLSQILGAQAVYLVYAKGSGDDS